MNNQQSQKYNSSNSIVIGGPSRCGKTTLANLLYEEKGQIIGLPVEGLLKDFLFKKYPLFSYHQKRIFVEYLKLLRCTSEDKKISASPSDFIKTRLNILLKDFPKRCFSHPLQVVGYALDKFTLEHDGQGWAVCDLHSERYYGYYKKQLPNLKLALMIRNPKEAICASLYWRCYPNRPYNAFDKIKTALTRWIYSVNTYFYWKKLYPSFVEKFFFNHLVAGNKNEEVKIENMLGLDFGVFRNHFEGYPLFTLKDNKFFSPTGKFESLLSDSELDFIDSFSRPYLHRLGLSTSNENGKSVEIGTRPYIDYSNSLKRIESICRKSPDHKDLDRILFPLQSVSWEDSLLNTVNSVKNEFIWYLKWLGFQYNIKY